MKLSLTLPSLFPDALKAAVTNIYATTRSVDYEIVVVSPFEARGPHITWVREEQPRGNCHAHNVAFQHSTGDIIVALSDDALVLPGWDEQALAFLHEREGDAPYALGLHQSNHFTGTAFGIYYPFFPMMRRRTIEAIGGYYPSEFRAHFADPDIGMRVWSAGGRCEFSPQPLIARVQRDEGPLERHKSASLDGDMRLFLSRWQPVYGAGWAGDELRDFNIDLDFVLGLLLTRDHTIHFNNPVLAGLARNYFANIDGRNIQVLF